MTSILQGETLQDEFFWVLEIFDEACREEENASNVAKAKADLEANAWHSFHA